MIQDTFNHWAHHRGQMTVYLRLMGAKVPALYGPSADDNLDLVLRLALLPGRGRRHRLYAGVQAAVVLRAGF